MTQHDPGDLLADTPDAGLLHGLRARMGLLRTVRVWGLHVEYPRRRLDAAERWQLRNGGFEFPEAKAAMEVLDPALPVVELGGGMGLIACHINRLLVHRDAHVVVEMDRRLLPYLERNRRRNGAGYVVLHNALSYAGGPITFASGHRNYQGQSLSRGGGSETAHAITLQEIVEAQQARDPGQDWSRFNLVADVEGMEADLVDKEGGFLARHAERIVMEMHPSIVGPRPAAAMVEGLQGLGFSLDFLYDSVYGFRRSRATKGVQPRMRTA